MARFHGWLRRKSRKTRPVDDKEMPDPTRPLGLPVLPSQRQRSLTATTPHQDSNTDYAPRGARFFEKLPLELRQQIYIAAFGGRTIHMDLQFNYREQPLGPARGNGKFLLHAESSDRNYEGEESGWTWWSSVCHRHPRTDIYPALDGCLDSCRSGGQLYTVCARWPGKIPYKCFIGVMGWLKTCRQAYIEGIDVLFRTNTIHIESMDLIMYFPRLVLSQRLDSIKSLELHWNLLLSDRNPRHYRRWQNEWAKYNDLISKVGGTFASMRTLYISVDTNTYLGPFSMRDTESEERQLLVPITKMVRGSAHKLVECQIAPSYSWYGRMLDRARHRDALVEEGGGIGAFHWSRFWQPVSTEVMEHGSLCSGFWVRRGADDTPPQPCVMRG